MIPEQKELLIKDLCARSPYGVKVIEDNQIIYSAAISNAFDIVSGFNWLDIKAILFPLSAINQEIEVNGEKVKIYNIINNNFNHRFFIDSDGDISIEGDDASYVYLQEYSFILDTFHRYHIDYRDLIGQGLAISVFDLPQNPYK